MTKFTVRAINRNKDYRQICSWWDCRDIPAVPLGLLPLNGFIVPGVCAGFLYLTDSDLAIIEGFISNPEATPITRNVGLDLITAALCARAKTLGYIAISAFTQLDIITSRATKHGFAVSQGQYRLVTRRI